MKKKHYALDVISVAIIIFNIISVISFMLPPGRAFYLPKWAVGIVRFLTIYSMVGLAFSGVLGITLNVISIIIKKKKQSNIKNNIVYMVLFVLTIPLAWLLFNIALSV